jgi:hypothetical protein
MRLSENMRGALDFLSRTSPYMPFADQQRTFDALERRGLAVYRRVEDGHRYNGYSLTDAGRAALEQGDA